MTKHEIRMSNETTMTNDETARGKSQFRTAGPDWSRLTAASSLPFRHSFVIRISDFVIGGVRQ
jgi:hypothetical protein